MGKWLELEGVFPRPPVFRSAPADAGRGPVSHSRKSGGGSRARDACEAQRPSDRWTCRHLLCLWDSIGRTRRQRSATSKSRQHDDQMSGPQSRRSCVSTQIVVWLLMNARLSAIRLPAWLSDPPPRVCSSAGSRDRSFSSARCLPPSVEIMDCHHHDADRFMADLATAPSPRPSPTSASQTFSPRSCRPRPPPR